MTGGRLVPPVGIRDRELFECEDVGLRLR